jgi:hypothetical protein
VVAPNEAAKDIVGRAGLKAIGRPLNEVWPVGASMIPSQVEESTTYPDVVFASGSDAVCYDVVVSPFQGNQ